MGIGALETPSSERERLTALSRDWVCSRCNHSNLQSLPDPNDSVTSVSASPPTTTEAKTSRGADASDDPTLVPAEAVDVTVTPVFRSPEIEPSVPVSILFPPGNNVGCEAEAVANGTNSSYLSSPSISFFSPTSLPPPSASRGGHQVGGTTAPSLHQTRTHTHDDDTRSPADATGHCDLSFPGAHICASL